MIIYIDADERLEFVNMGEWQIASPESTESGYIRMKPSALKLPMKLDRNTVSQSLFN